MENTMTEREAGNKFCPEALYKFNMEIATCKGSDCMAWRWHSEETLEKGYGEKDEVISYGYCGKVPLTWNW